MVYYGENGIIRKAQEAKEIYSNSTLAEQEAMDTLLEEYDKTLSGGNYTDKYNDNTLPVAPRLANGMTKVKWNSNTNKWEKVTDDSTQWYDYANKEWANVVLVGEDGKDATGSVDVFNSDGTLNENSAYTQLVWIPRYAYKITSQYHTEGTGAGNIEIVFIDTNNQNKDKSKTYSTTYPDATVGGGMADYIVHPAFDYGGEHLSGFWMGKFESSNTNCTTDVTTGQVAYTGNEVMTVKANVTSWRQISTGDAFSACLNLNRAGNSYGLSTSDSVVDPHMAKNDEWGAVAYLSQSSYGKKAEVWNNSNTSFITGMAGSGVDAASEDITNAYNTTLGVEASTSGNVTGIYDMSGGNWERTAAYVDNGHQYLAQFGGDLVAEGTDNKYRNVYTSTVSDGSDSQEADYILASPTNGRYGDAVWEISGGTGERYITANSWYSDFSVFPYINNPFFQYGGKYSDSTVAGVFCYAENTGVAYNNNGFRLAMAVM